MQHHPWILPWGVPLQKVVAVPLHPAAAHPHHHHPGIPQPLHPHHHQHPHPAAVHVPAGVLGLPPTPLAALRTFVTASQAASVPATPRPRKVGQLSDTDLIHEITRFYVIMLEVSFWSVLRILIYWENT
jgi:hypothetical protein